MNVMCVAVKENIICVICYIRNRQTYIGGFELVDDGGFSTVVQAETQHIHLLLQPQPSCQLVKQPHWLASNHQLPL